MSLSYVLGGVAALLFARQVLAFGGSWRAVMGVPSLVLLLLLVLCAVLVRTGPLHPPSEQIAGAPRKNRWTELGELLRKPQFIIACAVSFAVTLLRDAFNHWSVDFLTDAQGKEGSVATAALHSIGFDLAGAVAILANGYLYDRIRPERRGWLVATSDSLRWCCWCSPRSPTKTCCSARCCSARWACSFTDPSACSAA
jgi:sugar phosphate permease